jgi:hypothetical protein
VGALLSSHYEPCIAGPVATKMLSPELCSLQCTSHVSPACLDIAVARALGLRHTRFIAYSLMAEGVGLLERLCLLSETPERQCLLGSAYKRQAWIGMGDSVQDSLKAAAKVRCFPCRLALMGAFRNCTHTMDALVDGGVIIGSIMFSWLSGFLLLAISRT